MVAEPELVAGLRATPRLPTLIRRRFRDRGGGRGAVVQCGSAVGTRKGRGLPLRGIGIGICKGKVENSVAL